MTNPRPLFPSIGIPAAAARRLSRARTMLTRLGRDTSGTSLLEFAFTLPLVLAVGCWGVELSSLALCHLRVSQYALNLADNASRVGLDAGAGVSDMREGDINDVLQGAKLEGAAIHLTDNARITLSSLENIQQSYDTARVQRIHWQRCIGAQRGTFGAASSGVPGVVTYDSNYGSVAPTAGSDGAPANAGVTVANMGPAASPVTAPNDTGVMFVEVNYLYKPLFGSIYVKPQIIHYIASYIVRDNRSFVKVYNTSPQATASTCDKYSA